jgi:hypothetical protein
MLRDWDIQFVHPIALEDSIALVWVIDGQCLYDLPLHNKYAAMFLNNDEVIDVSDEYPDHTGITVRFMKNGQAIEDFQTTEYFGSILLSSPQLVDLSLYPNGRYVVSPHATFDGQRFTITNRDMTGLPEWDDRYE